MRAFPAATREDAPGIVRDLVAAGEDVFAVRVLTSTLEDAYLEAVGRAPARRAGEAAALQGRAPDDTPESAGLTPPGPLRGALIVARFSLRESLRRRVFIVIGVLTIVFLVLYGLATWQAFVAADEFTGGTEAGVEADKVVGATLAGLAMFAILFLGTILAVFLTLGAVRGDAERGLLQPLLVRPLPRRTLLLGRWLGATAVCAPYVMLIALAAFALTFALGGWWPDRLVGPLLALGLGVAIIAALSLAGSIVLASTANGIAVFMLFGAGLDGGPARPDRRGDRVRQPRRHLAASPPGRCRSRRSTRPASRSSPPTPSASPAWRSISARSAARSRAAPACGSGRSPTWSRSAPRRWPRSPAATSSPRGG